MNRRLSRFALRPGPCVARAFTLIEILVTLAILALIAGLAMGHLINAQTGAEKSAARLMVRQSMRLPLHTYRATMREFPSTAEGLRALVVAPPGKEANWAGPYFEGNEVPKDPWGEPYHYASPGLRNKSSYDVWSSGPDKRSGTPDDIGNWPAETEEREP